MIVKRILRVIMITMIVIFLIAVAFDVASSILSHNIRSTFEGGILDEVEYIEVRGHTLAYRTYGEANERTLVFIHGFMGNSFDYHALSTALQDDYRIIAIDLIGFGQSDKPLDYDYSKANQAETIKAALDALDISPFALGGHSMGGEIALRLIRAHPDAAKRLILFASAGLQTSQPSGFPPFINEFIVKNYFVQRLGFNFTVHQPDDDVKDHFKTMFYMNTEIPGDVIREFSKAEDDENVIDFLDTLVIETLIIYGAEDRVTPPAFGETFDEALANSAYVLLEAIGHLPFIEAPEAVEDALRAFLEE